MVWIQRSNTATKTPSLSGTNENNLQISAWHLACGLWAGCRRASRGLSGRVTLQLFGAQMISRVECVYGKLYIVHATYVSAGHEWSFGLAQGIGHTLGPLGAGRYMLNGIRYFLVMICRASFEPPDCNDGLLIGCGLGVARMVEKSRGDAGQGWGKESKAGRPMRQVVEAEWEGG
ncbi:hypothetical protein B0H10DRAFT_1955145 [Mycena sp. CBHHK59/15]|nr:hypothetical protein B0H10DRAFT_1955145 [Mycena sp. CBHHK59/15]